jgi:hypothetical protein
MIRSERGLFHARRRTSKLKVLKAKIRQISEALTLDDQVASLVLQEAIETLTNEMMRYGEIRQGLIQIDIEQLDIIARLPQLLIEARMVLGWSQREMADRAGMPLTQLSRYERTEYRSISLARLQLIAKLLHSALANDGQ